MTPFSLHRALPFASLGLTLGAAAIGVAAASDHQDTPEVELNALSDMTDVYAFPSPTAGRIVLVMNSRAFLTPAQSPSAGFDRNLLYQFKIDNTGDAVEDRVIQVTFSGSGADQQVQVRGPMAPGVIGAMNNEVASTPPALSGRIGTALGSTGGLQVFAGPRDDPFFIDLEQFFRIVPDRKPVTGQLSQLPDQPSASAFRAAGQAVNYVAGFNVLSIIIELPVSDLTTGGNPRIGIWGTISR
ncbi:MAG TPA: DUF4331 family protein [Gemmatimonadales bacterium]